MKKKFRSSLHYSMQGDTFLETIKSVLNQSYQNWEMIIVDDCSSDQSVSIVEKFLVNDKRIRILKNDINLGPGGSRNKAINAASGDIIAFLDSDDIWHPEKLSKHLEFMEKNSSVFSHTHHMALLMKMAKDKINFSR